MGSQQPDPRKNIKMKLFTLGLAAFASVAEAKKGKGMLAPPCNLAGGIATCVCDDDAATSVNHPKECGKKAGLASCTCDDGSTWTPPEMPNSVPRSPAAPVRMETAL